MTENSLLLNLIESIIGRGKPTSRGNYSFVCPFHVSNPPGKMNFEINLTKQENEENPWHCWGCDVKGKKLISLFKKLKVSSDKIQELKSYVKVNGNDLKIQLDEIKNIELPKQFKSLDKPSGIISKHALLYLKKRGVTQNDIIKYQIGYCESGPYNNMIILPSFDENGKLNYFTGRSFQEDPFIKYKNPQASRNIIPFELYINWNLPITLCEGIFDAIAIKRNAIPLLGKNIQSELMKKLISSNVEKIYIALDKDAIKQSLEHCKMLMNEGKEIYLVDLEDKDPSKIGHKGFINIISKTLPLDYSGLMSKKLEMI